MEWQGSECEKTLHKLLEHSQGFNAGQYGLQKCVNGEIIKLLLKGKAMIQA